MKSVPVHLPPFQQLLDAHRDEVYRFLVFTAGPGRGGRLLPGDDARGAPGVSRRCATTRTCAGGCSPSPTTRRSTGIGRAPGDRYPSSDLPEQPVAPVEIEDPTLWAAVRRLPEKQRAAVVLRFVADLPYARIAAITGGTEAAARQNVRAGLIRLREEWTP